MGAVVHLRAWRGALMVVLALATGVVVRAATTVLVRIDLRAEIAAGRFDPARDTLGLRGSLAPLSWQRSVPLRAVGDGHYAVELRFERRPFGGQPVACKLHIARPGADPGDGWEPGRNHALWLDAPAPPAVRAFGAPAEPVPPQRTGTLQPLGLVASRHVQARAVQVWLPPGYAADGARRHPVLYLHDGQNLFDGQAAVAEWQVDETAQRLVLAGAIEPPIIVAVDHGPDRVLDYTPVAARPGPGRAPIGGGAAAYARFLVDELKPLIDRRYRTRLGAADTAVGGSSAGALVSLWLALHHGDTFGQALIVSPAVWWGDAFALRDVAAWPEGTAPRPRLWLDVGAEEGESTVRDVRALRQALAARGWTPDALVYVEDPQGGHDEASWAARVEPMLRFLYGRPLAAR